MSNPSPVLLVLLLILAATVISVCQSLVPTDPSTLQECEVSGDIRLVGGANDFEGRVEVCINNTWGTVCDDHWDYLNTLVICRQMGFYETDNVLHWYPYGEGTGQIWLDDVHCIGSEARLVDCDSNMPGDNDCSHNEDIGVQCNLSGNSTCNDGDIRLVGGENESEGHVEICLNNLWGTVCDDEWSWYNAYVVCRQVGFNTTDNLLERIPGVLGARLYKLTFFGEGTGPIQLDDVRCTGNEVRLIDCAKRSVGHNCQHNEDVGAKCLSVNATCNNGDIRLVGGENESEGRVEICLNNLWGTVCDDLWSWYNTYVVCRQVGFTTTEVLPTSYVSGEPILIHFKNYYFGEGTGPILLDDVQCTGNEVRLIDCVDDNRIGVHNCEHNEDVGVTCVNHHVSHVNDSCVNGDIRLAGGMNEFEGRVEICLYNFWGTVCNDNWHGDNVNAAVVCKQLGFSPTGSIVSGEFGEGRGPIWLDDVMCTANDLEARLIDCEANDLQENNCYHLEDVGVKCLPGDEYSETTRTTTYTTLDESMLHMVTESNLKMEHTIMQTVMSTSIESKPTYTVNEMPTQDTLAGNSKETLITAVTVVTRFAETPLMTAATVDTMSAETQATMPPQPPKKLSNLSAFGIVTGLLIVIIIVVALSLLLIVVVYRRVSGYGASTRTIRELNGDNIVSSTNDNIYSTPPQSMPIMACETSFQNFSHSLTADTGVEVNMGVAAESQSDTKWFDAWGDGGMSNANRIN